ncbi:hypothetical protein PR048_000202 [Dryococelus australis]|uniref:Uncharacterized protein n=1 Tax=Dryococelus australis TaxID=614101 RepID=A0ABQ9IF92_9NEOP|nr:hypothetical protein PR048_000202 [Dryococelus australis]
MCSDSRHNITTGTPVNDEVFAVVTLRQQDVQRWGVPTADMRLEGKSKGVGGGAEGRKQKPHLPTYQLRGFGKGGKFGAAPLDVASITAAAPDARSGVEMIYRRPAAQLEEEHCTVARPGDEHLYAKTRLGKVKEAAGIAERRMEGARVCEAELVASSSHQTALGSPWGWGGGKREIPEKTCRPATSSGTSPTCENPGRDDAGNRTRFALTGGESALASPPPRPP